MTQLPYLASPGNISKALSAIKVAATPPKVSQDFVKTKLGIPGSSGDQITTFLKRLGFAASDGTPTDLYRAYRGGDGKKALASAIRAAYSPLFDRNEYLYDCNDSKIKDHIIEETGLAKEARPVALIFQTLKQLMNAADFSGAEDETPVRVPNASIPKLDVEHSSDDKGEHSSRLGRSQEGIKLNLGYTINLNLPETSDIEVFNAIFKSLRETLLKGDS